ncbi:DUF397 domain-containing protein [Streptomyces sp. DSM 44917]|uniref:DUF397 domain-containing protein n=1 Tax=Streptomyces boetiae TaxID=3075541 RepID=A0ABU2L1M0_9ACTN|nr:DUF397 domain-containing protein [Streptomyces sp. DSM 44917]MDT0305461.1 DUF397 domain-containing protein [Streptomyces sp. DSM 44917]
MTLLNELLVLTWRKSSYSGPNGGDCVEVGTWRKSSYSSPNGGDCVEIRLGVPGAVPVRDSKNIGPALVFPAADWAGFLTAVRRGEL